MEVIAVLWNSSCARFLFYKKTLKWINKTDCLVWEPAWSFRNWHKSTENSLREWLQCLFHDNDVKTFIFFIYVATAGNPIVLKRYSTLYIITDRGVAFGIHQQSQALLKELCIYNLQYAALVPAERNLIRYRLQGNVNLVPFTWALLKRTSSCYITWLDSFDECL